ncbi:MAG: hypothetical protein WCC87_26240 [Candidatus Korobacteraceae bacterium]
MSKVAVVLLAMVLSIPVIAFAQNSGQQDDKKMQQEENQAAMTSVTGENDQARHNMSGMVSSDGKMLTSGNTTYTVSNPKALKSYDNQSVSVVFVFNTDTNTIHIVSATPGPAQ